MQYKIKIITGFREDQYYTIDAQEAHKAYYLFNNPSERGTFENGVALTGDIIKGIEPDYHATLGLNPNYKLEAEDWNEIKGKGIDVKLRSILSKAQKVSKLPNPPIKQKLTEAIKLLPPEQILEETKQLSDKFKI